jgi:hypothetical protein
MVARQNEIDRQRIEALGPAERIIQALTTYMDHVVHNRPGMVVEDARTKVGVRWEPVTWKEENGQKVVYRLDKIGNKQTRTRIGVLDGIKVMENRRQVGEYRKPGIFPEVATWLYRQVAEVYKLDNEFAAHWASWVFSNEHRDLKVVLAAFLLVQSRCGEPVVEDGKILFHDEDFRDVGEAMCLIRAKSDLNPKLLLRLGDVLSLPGVAAINRELGFGKSARTPARGRYYKAIEKWLKYREDNPKMLEGLVAAGFRTSVMELARRAGYKPSTPKFFEVLRWKQAQAKDGRRQLAIGTEVKKAETWQGLSEKKICERIVKTKPNYKRIVGLLPAEVGLTRAIMMAAIEAGSVSDTDLIILTPTLEELGLLTVKEVADRWKKATETAESQRAANIAKRVKGQAAKEVLQDAADTVAKKAMEEVMKDLRIYAVIDKSGSMQGAIEQAKLYLAKLLVGFPLERLHCSVFNTMGSEVAIKHPSAKGIEQAFRGHFAGGGTSYAEGVKALAKHKPQASEDSIMLFVGDELDHGTAQLVATVNASGIRPVAFGLLRVVSNQYGGGSIVRDAAKQLNIPCFDIEESIFADPYAVTRVLRNLIATTPVVAAARVAAAKQTLVEEILKTKLLEKPVWA